MFLRVKRWVFGVTYLLMAAFGVAGLGTVRDAASTEDRLVALFAGSLFALIGALGLLLLLFVPVHARLRPAAGRAVAPSGAPALYFRRSPFLLVVSLVFCLGLGAWLAAAAVVLVGYGQVGWAVPPGVCAPVLLWPVVVATTGRVVPGGLWLTPSGLEYRKEAVSWTVAWSALRGVEHPADALTDVDVLPRANRRGVAAVAPVVLSLREGCGPEVRWVTRWAWHRECRAPRGMLCVDCVDLAGGPTVIAETIGRCLAYPGFRTHLGTEWSMPRRPA